MHQQECCMPWQRMARHRSFWQSLIREESQWGRSSITTFIGMFAFLASIFGDGAIYIWLLNASGVTGFIFWLGIAMSHYRFRKAFIAQGHSLDELPYKAKWYPFGPIFAIIVCLIVILAQDYQAFMGSHIDWKSLVVAYLGIPLFLVMWFGYKIIKKTKVIPLHECVIDADEYND